MAGPDVQHPETTTPRGVFQQRERLPVFGAAGDGCFRFLEKGWQGSLPYEWRCTSHPRYLLNASPTPAATRVGLMAT